LLIEFLNTCLDKFTGEIPANYFLYFKKVIKAGKKDSYWRYNPGEDIKSRKNPVKRLKEDLEADEYIKLLTAGKLFPAH